MNSQGVTINNLPGLVYNHKQIMTPIPTTMIVLYAVYGLAVVLQLLLEYKLFWRLRKLIALLCCLMFSVSSIGLLVGGITAWNVCLVVVAVYSVFNLARIFRRRLVADFLQAVNNTAVWLSLLQATLIVAVAVYHAPSGATICAVVAVAQIIVAIGLLQSTRRQLAKTAYDAGLRSKHVADNQLPSITVVIPARNEDAQLEACLDAILRSDYPKLEVIVLDDCSADRTPDIIKQYAHDGVRFIPGTEPSDGWLPKNQAYDRLLKEASGKLVLFCGVDVRVRPDSIRLLQTAMQAKHKTMIGVLPQNTARKVSNLQAMRYYWEMVPPRRLFKRPPVLSSCWLVTRSELVKAGGFAAVKHSMSPESYFARQAIQRNDAYSFIRSNAQLGITSDKSAQDQRETAVYSRYPQLHRRPELVLLLAMAELILLLGPIILVPLSVLLAFGWLPAVLSALAFGLNSYTFGLVQHAIFPNASFARCLAAFMTTIVTDIWYVHVSMYKYEFSEVLWKQRNVCYPVMHVYPHLPKLP